jgi:hypothetical protein
VKVQLEDGRTLVISGERDTTPKGQDYTLHRAERGDYFLRRFRWAQLCFPLRMGFGSLETGDSSLCRFKWNCFQSVSMLVAERVGHKLCRLRWALLQTIVLLSKLVADKSDRLPGRVQMGNLSITILLPSFWSPRRATNFLGKFR